MFIRWWSACCAFAVSHTQQQARVQCVLSLTMSLSTCPRQCIYVILSVCNAHVTEMSYESGVRGACSNGRGVLHGAKWVRWCLALNASLEIKPVGWGGHSAASKWNAPPWFKVQPPESEGPRDHLRPPTQVNSFTASVLFLPFPLDFILVPWTAILTISLIDQPVSCMMSKLWEEKDFNLTKSKSTS